MNQVDVKRAAAGKRNGAAQLAAVGKQMAQTIKKAVDKEYSQQAHRKRLHTIIDYPRSAGRKPRRENQHQATTETHQQHTDAGPMADEAVEDAKVMTAQQTDDKEDEVVAQTVDV